MLASLCVHLIRKYRKLISPLYLCSCTLTPSCSQYAEEAITKYGAGQGAFLAFRRLIRCRPFSRIAFDPVP